MYKNVDPEKIKAMLENERFEELILITTTAMEAGVNIFDDEIKHIVCDGILDPGILIQCIGRKRLQHKDDYINLYIKSISNQQLGGKYSGEKNKIEIANYFIEHGQVKLVNKNYRKLNDNMIYDQVTGNGDEIKKKLNLLMYFRTLTNIRNFEIAKTFNGKHSYCRFLTEHVFKLGKFSLYEADGEMEILEKYLNEKVGKVMLMRKDRDELIEVLNVRDGRNNRLLKGIQTLNGALKERRLDYCIEEFTTSKQINGKRKIYKSAWKVRRLSDD